MVFGKEIWGTTKDRDKKARVEREIEWMAIGRG